MTAVDPSVYNIVSDHLAQTMPDFVKITNSPVATDTRKLVFHFGVKDQRVELIINQLSDEEKCFVVYALTIAASSGSESLLCFWDEPDSFLSPDEVGPSVMALRHAFKSHGQLILTSHNPEAIRRFSDANTLHLSRSGHLEPTVVTSVEILRSNGLFEGGFVDALIRGDIDP